MSLTFDACSGNSPSPPLDLIHHVIIACQENHSFDAYFGHYPRAGKFGIPSNYSQPDGRGITVKPYHFSSPPSTDIGHIWLSIHNEWNHGAMDGLFTTDRPAALGYVDRSMLGPTFPNRLTL